MSFKEHLGTKFEEIKVINNDSERIIISKAKDDNVYQVTIYRYSLPLKTSYTLDKICYMSFEKCKETYEI